MKLPLFTLSLPDHYVASLRDLSVLGNEPDDSGLARKLTRRFNLDRLENEILDPGVHGGLPSGRDS